MSESTKTKVLIIDDEEILAKNLQLHFQRSGWEARVAGTGEAAVAAAAEFEPGAILIDYNLPDMKGFEALEAIRATHCCSAVLMTGHPPDEVKAGALRLRIGRTMSKPFPMAGLKTELAAAAAEFCATCVANGKPSRSGCGGFPSPEDPSLLGKPPQSK